MRCPSCLAVYLRVRSNFRESPESCKACAAKKREAARRGHCQRIAALPRPGALGLVRGPKQRGPDGRFLASVAPSSEAGPLRGGPPARRAPCEAGPLRGGPLASGPLASGPLDYSYTVRQESYTYMVGARPRRGSAAVRSGARVAAPCWQGATPTRRCEIRCGTRATPCLQCHVPPCRIAAPWLFSEGMARGTHPAIVGSQYRRTNGPRRGRGGTGP